MTGPGHSPPRPKKVSTDVVEAPVGPADRAARRRERRDGIVQAPRGPRKTIGERLRRGASEPRATSDRSGRRVVSILAGVLGAAGLICSIILAVGALLAARGADDTGAFYSQIADICDVLVGPLREVFSFSGANADMKEALVTWGAGSIGYLLIGLVGQSLLRSADHE